MRTVASIPLSLEETRRRSIQIWEGGQHFHVDDSWD